MAKRTTPGGHSSRRLTAHLCSVDISPTCVPDARLRVQKALALILAAAQEGVETNSEGKDTTASPEGTQTAPADDP